MSLRYFFQTILMVVTDSCYNLKSPPYAPAFYVQNIKMCIHSQGVRISTFFPILLLFQGYSSSANQIYATIQNRHCKRFIFEITRSTRAGGHHVRSLVSFRSHHSIDRQQITGNVLLLFRFFFVIVTFKIIIEEMFLSQLKPVLAHIIK